MINRFILVVCITISAYSSYSQTIAPDILNKPWKAVWITGPGTTGNMWATFADQSLKDYGVYKFRKQIDLAAKPASFMVHVSGDNRYKLYVNNKLVSQGPARGDLYFWNFETVDLAPFLHAGTNTVAALVWNDGRLKPEAQISFMTAFILQGNTPSEEILNTNDTWKCIRDSGYQPLVAVVPGYYVAGSGQLMDMNKTINGWEQPGYNDANWSRPRLLFQGLTKNTAIDSRGWMLVPSPLPQTEMTMQRLKAVRKAAGIQATDAFLAGNSPLTIPANTNATLLLDQSFLTNAYPTLLFSKGKNARLSLTYQEALYELKQKADGSTEITSGKGNRNDVDGKVMFGKTDSMISSGANGQQFASLWWRTYRYVQLHVETAAEPLVLNDFYGSFTGYPFQNNALFHGGNPLLQQILDVGWRTARLCAFETYMDCPYYEQLQYIGDARIQALVTIYNSGDDRLVRNALDLMDHSRIPEGITLSRYPTDLQQQIPTFSLWWIGMLHDYWMYATDSAFVRRKLSGTRQVLDFFNSYQQRDGSLKNVPYWIFSDWVPAWPRGIAPIGKNGESAVLDLQLLWTYKLAAEMEARLGLQQLGGIYRARAAQLQAAVQRKYWNPAMGLYADTEEKKTYSQHTNSLAILAGVASGTNATRLAIKLEKDSSLTPASIYFKYYLHQALVKAGLGDHYMDWLTIWKQNLDMGLTTWAETSDISSSRSDCHAWGSSPNIEFYRTVLGIDSDAPGYSKVHIEPHLGVLKQVSGEVPHPNGKIKASYVSTGTRWAINIDLPEQVTGRLVWKGKTYMLKGGSNSLTL